MDPVKYGFAITLCFILMVQLSDAGDCLDVQQHNQCPYFDGGTCYNLRKNLYNCTGNLRYHCAWNKAANRFTEACITPTICGLGKEPILYSRLLDGKQNHVVLCEKCRESYRFNPKNETWSNDISECPKTKSRCGQADFKVLCDYENEFDQYTQDVKCRCDVRRGYRIAMEFSRNQSTCIFDIGFDCMKAKCYPEKDLSLTGYVCLPKCSAGFSRTDERSDNCIPEIIPSPAITGVVSPGPPGEPGTEELTSKPTTPTPKPTVPTTLATVTTSTISNTTVVQTPEDKDSSGISTATIIALSVLGALLGIVGIGVILYTCRKKLKQILRDFWNKRKSKRKNKRKSRTTTSENHANEDEETSFFGHTGLPEDEPQLDDETDDELAKWIAGLNNKDKAEMQKKVIVHIHADFVEKQLDPDRILDRMVGCLYDVTIRNIRQEKNTTEKNIAILERIKYGSWETYEAFKVSLFKIKCDVFLDLIKKEEIRCMEEAACGDVEQQNQDPQNLLQNKKLPVQQEIEEQVVDVDFLEEPHNHAYPQENMNNEEPNKNKLEVDVHSKRLDPSLTVKSKREDLGETVKQQRQTHPPEGMQKKGKPNINQSEVHVNIERPDTSVSQVSKQDDLSQEAVELGCDNNPPVGMQNKEKTNKHQSEVLVNIERPGPSDVKIHTDLSQSQGQASHEQLSLEDALSEGKHNEKEFDISLTESNMDSEQSD